MKMESKRIIESKSDINCNTLSEYQKLKQKFQKSICLIEINNKRISNGILVKIPFGLYKHPYMFIDKTYYALIIHNFNLDKKDISLYNEIKIILNDKPYFLLTIDNYRKIYRSKNKDGITIIEIKDTDGLDVDSFLYIDPKIIYYEGNNIYLNNYAYLINNQYENNLEFLTIFIKNIQSGKYEIKDFNSLKKISIGSPIINVNNSKLIGIYNDYDSISNSIIGASIKVPIHKFKKKIIKELKEEQNENENDIENGITIIYKCLGKNKIKLFGKEFVDNN